MDFDAVADELYAGSREAFIATRAERVAAAKKAGEKELAKRISELRKPSIAAWLVNQLARQHAGEFAELVELGEQLRGAHADLDGERLRELSTRKRLAVEKLAERVTSLGPEPTAAVLDQVTGTLEAAVASADTAAEVAAGRLDTAVAPSGFEQWLIAPVASSPRPKPAPRTPAPTEPADSPRERRRQDKLAEARERLAAAATTRTEAEDVLATADDAAAQAAKTAADLQARLAAAEREVRKLRDVAGQARRAYDSAVRAAGAAEKAVHRIELQ
ncbi:MAG: hypothetical protein ACRDQB_09000 [Thermocrispum sp.]